MYDKIKQLFVECANVDEKLIKPEARLKEDLGFDSLYAVEMALELESNFDIQLQDDEIRKLITVQDVINLVESKVKEK